MHKQWRLDTQFGQEKIVMADIKQLFSASAPSTERVDDMMTAVAEACLNAFEHGNQMRAEAHVLVEMTGQNDKIRFRVTDEGTGFPYNPAMARERAAVRAAINDSADRGWGVMLITNLADSVRTGFENDRFFMEMHFLLRERVHHA